MARLPSIALALALALALPLALALASACDDSDGSTVSGALDGPVVRYPEPDWSEGGDAASIEGRLVIDEGCLYVAGHETGERYPIVWPAGTSWDPESKSVVSPSGERMPVDNDVLGGGGFHYVDYIGSEAEALVSRCVDNRYGEVAFVNNNDDAISPAE